ncbi:unnamed protein product [Paramecium sonneborni]|uniref:Uncharacterized protein n=1 Tax=Paramecium sonneborni TaxID=65129 RepID=A0A8S1M161_9CILI|nr:unnamed protein product [Paramecium sonneborni]
MIFDLQPPSPSLSPNSKTRFYQDQLDKAHQVIDQLELLLSEKEHQKKIHQTTYNNIVIPPLQLKQIDSERSKSYMSIPLQYSTPRDRRTRLSLGGLDSARYIEEMKNRHSEIILQSKEDNIYREQKNKELNDQIQELKSELIFCQEKQSITKKEKQSTEQKLDILNAQIQAIQMQLTISKEKGKHLQKKIKQINHNNEILEENEEDKQEQSENQKQLQKQVQPVSLIIQQNNNSHKKLIGSLQQEIQLLENKKQKYFNQVTNSQFEEKQIEVKEDHFNDRQNLDIEVSQNQNILITSDSGAQLNTFTEENISSINSFRARGHRKNRSCESCQIF